jgi:hypothetical protein
MRGETMVATGDPIEMTDVRGPGAFDQLIKLEQAASRIFLIQPIFVPGVLQSEGYAEEMIARTAGLQAGSQELSDRVNLRLQRGAALDKRLQAATPPQVWVVLDEGALRRVVGGADSMREQLGHLASMAKRNAVYLGIIPLSYGAHAGLKGSFEVHELANGEAAVFFEGSQGDELVGTDQELVVQFREAAEALMTAAISGADALELLEAISDTL